MTAPLDLFLLVLAQFKQAETSRIFREYSGEEKKFRVRSLDAECERKKQEFLKFMTQIEEISDSTG